MGRMKMKKGRGGELGRVVIILLLKAKRKILRSAHTTRHTINTHTHTTRHTINAKEHKHTLLGINSRTKYKMN